ncbi:PREDICTED: Fanconi anemia group I protein [Tarenaya hassleriana]|uniref:Fanconi anemia group I protein n=1 Tax=Tarenaya hassleriana TaxID=28532 RepID=UPI00053C9742|nr:PREDICTED: Fanconi anemia group I protein [Tarenaya hassleriana]
MTAASVAGEPQVCNGQRPLSDDDIVRLAHYHYSQTGFSLPPYLLSPTSHAPLVSYLRSRSSSPSPSKSVSEYVVSLLSLISLSPTTPSLSSLLSSLLLSYTQLFNSGKIPRDSNSLKTIQLFNTLLRYLPVKDLQSVVDSILSDLSSVTSVDDAQLFDLLPGCFDILRKPNEFVRSDVDFVNSAIDRVLENEWSKGLLIKVVSLAKELPFLDKVRKSELLEKVFQGIRGIDLQDLPSVVYQLLVLASKGFCKKEVIEGICGFFGSKSGTTGTSIVRQVEGTVLLHVNFAVKQDPSLGQEVVRLVKSNLRAFNHFTFAVLLSVARIRRFGENSLGVLRTGLLTAYIDYGLSKDCKWLPDELKEEYSLHLKSVEQSLLRAVSESSCGREHVIPSVIQFGFMLLESVEEGRCKEFGDSNGVLGLEQLSIQILGTVFEVHDMTRKEIIEQCKFRILSLNCEKSIPIVRLLGYLVRSYSYPMLEYVHHIKELLDYFTYMEGSISSCLVTAVIPLIKFSRDLQDYSILVIRKAMFSREETVRVSAANAIINLILAEKQFKKESSFTFQDSSSQASSSQQAEMSCIMQRSLFNELNGLLQRCLYQQAKVRDVIYNGLLELVIVDPSSGVSVLDFLLPHFLRFFRQDIDFHLGLASCIKTEGSKVVIEEPVDSLLSCISWILILQPLSSSDRPSDASWPCFGFSLSQENEGRRNASHEEYSSTLLKVRSLLRQGKIEDIIEQSQDVESASLQEDKKKSCALILSGILEVLLNSIATELEKGLEGKKGDLEKEIADLIDLHQSLEKDMYKSKQSAGGKRIWASSDLGNAKVIDELKVPFLSTSSLYQLFLTMLKLSSGESISSRPDSQNRSQSSSAKTEKSISRIFSFTLQVCLGHIRSSLRMKEGNPLKKLVYGDIRILGPPLLKVIYLLKEGQVLATQQKKKGRKDAEERKQCLHFALLCLKELLTMCSIGSGSNSLLEDLLAVPVNDNGGVDDGCEETSKIDDPLIRSKEMFMGKILKPMILDLLAVPSSHGVEVLCDTMLMLGKSLPGKFRDRHGSWTTQICRSCETTNTSVAKSVVKLAISLTTSPYDLSIAEEMAKELQNIIGLEETESLQVSESFPIINQSTSATVTSCILQSIESAIVHMDWATKKLKTFSVVTQNNINFGSDGEHISGLGFEEALYSLAESVVRVLSCFVLMSLKDPQTEQFLRLAVRFYKQLAQITKLRIAAKGCRQILPSLKFQKLVELTCRQFTVPLYDFLAETQRDKQETNSNATKPKGIINKIKRENKCIPDLIFQIEDCERYLIQLSKVTKVNLLRHAKRSTARDFKILEVATEEDGPNQLQTEVSTHNGSEEQESEGDGSERILSAQTATPVSAHVPDSDSAVAADEDEWQEEEEENGVCNSRTGKRSRVVEDSEED